ncbi:MAG: 4-hydroxy-tetrahydrodipicolinate reductase [Gammaproteobacteria bacterium]|nr:4-hydroxy-tetrahydrodipicolinate reductase [Gammaproteobacteria bacterium]
MTTAIAINGASGRMGRALVQACVECSSTSLAAALVRVGSEYEGSDAGTVAGIAPTKVLMQSERSKLPSVDVWIDFTLPEGLMDALNYCLTNNIPMVIGTTGLSESQSQAITQAATTIPIVFAPNMSVGVNLCLNILQTAAKTLGEDYDIEIVEAHHKNKVDAPSGTALRMGEVIAESIGINLEHKAEYTRHGNIGVRKPGAIGFQTIRAGDIVGEHTVIFAGIGERVEIAHRATSRLTFARGAVRAATWLQDQPAGLYDMHNVLGLS